MKETITIVGSSSKLYNNLNKQLLYSLFNVIEIRHNDIYNVKSITNPIIFAYSKENYKNLDFLKTIETKRIGKIIIIDSTASDVYLILKYYNYPKIKYTSREYVSSLKNSYIIKVGVTVNNINDLKGYYGSVKITTYANILKSIENIFFDSSVKNIDTTINIFFNGPFLFKIIFRIQSLVYNINPTLFYLMRPSLIIFKKIGYKNYGYTFISNKII